MNILKNCWELLSPVAIDKIPAKSRGMNTNTGHFGIPNLVKKKGM
jgi:hypothetical protein